MGGEFSAIVIKVPGTEWFAGGFHGPVNIQIPVGAGAAAGPAVSDGDIPVQDDADQRNDIVDSSLELITRAVILVPLPIIIL